MKLGIDIDGCLADFNLAYGDLFIDVIGVDRFPSGWKEALKNNEFPPVWSWDTHFGYTKEETKLIWTKHIQSNPHFWESLASLPHALDTIEQLNRISRTEEVYFFTNRMGIQAKFQTERWLYNFGMDHPTVILVENKAPLLLHLGVDFFVDDKLDTMNKVAGTYEEARMMGKLYLKDAPYNRGERHRGFIVVSSVKEALQDAGL